MARHQPQHQLKPPQPPTPMRSRQPLWQESAAKFRLGMPVWAQPLLMLGGAWIVVMVIALTAVSTLLSPDSSSRNRTTGSTIARNTAEMAQSTKRQSRLPLWLFGAIALSCAAGSVLISQQAARPPRRANRPQRKMKQPRHLTPSPTPVVPEPPQPSLKPPSHPPAPATMPSFALSSPRRAQTTTQARSATAPVTLIQLAQMQSAGSPTMEQATVVPVTVVPAEEKAPLDWGEASLADKLDLRKQRSVSSLL